MFFFLCVCECSLTSAKSVQPDLSKVSANEASIKGESKECSFFFAFVSAAWLLQSQCSLIYLKSVQTKGTSKGKESILYGRRSLCYGLGTQYAYRVPRAHFGSKPLLRPWKPPGPSCIQPALIIPRSRYFSLPCINQRLELIDDGFSAMAESQFLPFFIRRPPKSIFSQFLHFVGRRRTVFTVFRVSSVDDECFFAISAFRLRATNDFQRFPFFRGVGNAACGIFRFSQT